MMGTCSTHQTNDCIEASRKETACGTTSVSEDDIETNFKVGR
jgi:hypothetical protein